MDQAGMKRTAVYFLGLRRLVLGGALAIGASFGSTAFAQQHHHHGGPGMEGPGMAVMGGGMFMGRPEHMSRMLDRLGATEAQRTQIRQIALAAGTDLQAQRESGRSLRAEGLQLLAAPTIDARAVEALRQRSLAQHDQVSKRATQAMLDIANVLTPEQRTKMAEQVRQRGERMRDRMRERGAAPRVAPGNS